MSDATIRRITPDDANVWREIRLEALRLAPTAFGSSYEEAAATDPQTLSQRIPSGEGPDVIFGAFVAGECIGTAGLHVETARKQRHKGMLWGVYVRETARRKGVAEALVRAVIACARSHVAILRLTVNAQNIAARELYERLGFVAFGVEPRGLRVNGTDYDEVLMALDFENGL